VTALTQPPGRLLSIADYAALSEDDRNRWELQEGNLVMSPSPTPRHMVIAAELIKRGEYADAGIPFYWIIDAEAPISLVACHLAGSFGYQDRGSVTGVFESAEPFPVRVDLDALC